MNTKANEFPNLKESKQNNILLGIYMDEMLPDNFVAESLYSIVNQNKNVDVLFILNNFSQEQKDKLTELAGKSYFITRKKGEKDEIIENKVYSDKKLAFSIYDADQNEKWNVATIFNFLFNAGAQNGYSFISVGEIEDTFSLKWFETASLWAEENKNISIFLPIIRSNINSTFTGFMNDGVWAEQMSEEAGKFDINILLRFNCSIPLGGLYRISEIQKYSEEKDGVYLPMKESIKLFHYYEFFLRMIYDDVKIMTVQRMGYEMRILRKEYYKDCSCKLPQDLTNMPIERGGVSPQEATYYYELSKKEYFFDVDRKKVFQATLAK